LRDINTGHANLARGNQVDIIRRLPEAFQAALLTENIRICTVVRQVEINQRTVPYRIQQGCQLGTVCQHRLVGTGGNCRLICSAYCRWNISHIRNGDIKRIARAWIGAICWRQRDRTNNTLTTRRILKIGGNHKTEIRTIKHDQRGVSTANQIIDGVSGAVVIGSLGCHDENRVFFYIDVDRRRHLRRDSTTVGRGKTGEPECYAQNHQCIGNGDLSIAFRPATSGSG